MLADSTRRFFETDLPRQAAADVHRLFGRDGSIAFRIGEGRWTFRFASPEPVVPGFDRRASLQLWIAEDAFAAFLAGSLDVTDAVRRGEVKAKGQLRLLELFGRFLQPEATTLGWDAGT